MKKGCFRCKHDFDGICSMYGSPTLTEEETAEEFECEYFKER